MKKIKICLKSEQIDTDVSEEEIKEISKSLKINTTLTKLSLARNK